MSFDKDAVDEVRAKDPLSYNGDRQMMKILNSAVVKVFIDYQMQVETGRWMSYARTGHTGSECVVGHTYDEVKEALSKAYPDLHPMYYQIFEEKAPKDLRKIAYVVVPQVKVISAIGVAKNRLYKDRDKLYAYCPEDWYYIEITLENNVEQTLTFQDRDNAVKARELIFKALEEFHNQDCCERR